MTSHVRGGDCLDAHARAEHDPGNGPEIAYKFLSVRYIYRNYVRGIETAACAMDLWAFGRGEEFDSFGW